PAAAPAVPALLKEAGSTDKELRTQVITVLGAVGPAAKDAVPELTLALGDPDWRPLAVHALGKIGKAAGSQPASALDRRAAAMRLGACEALGAIGADAKSAVIALSKRLQDPSGEVRKAAQQAMDRIQR